MQKTCTQCRQAFEITEDDLAFYEKVSPTFGGKKELIPPPTLCPGCRQQRRWAYRNEQCFYHRKCSKTGKQMISIYPAESRHTVYDAAEWWSDKWDPLEYGRTPDFNRPFFEQFHELMLSVPRPNLFGKNNENSLYTNHTDHAKNSYLCVDVGFGEDILYSKYVINGKNCTDCFMTNASELCYETLYTEGYNCVQTRICEGVSDSAFLYSCKGCHHCFLCWNLRDRSYCILNEQYTREAYEEYMQKVNLGSFNKYQAVLAHFEQALLAVPRQPLLMVNSEDCVGTCRNCKNVVSSFDMTDCRDCRHCFDCVGITDSSDTYESGFECELQHESHACNHSKTILGCNICYESHDLLYCDLCHNSRDLFGCSGLRKQRYCIFNKQYTKHEYETLVPKLIAHMRNTGEWGEFFPISRSPFAYNETIAQDELPLTKTEAKTRGWPWYEESKGEERYLGPAQDIPDDIHDVDESIVKKILTCEKSGKHYKIIPQELEFYRRMHLPIPRLCPAERYRNRMRLRGPQKLWKRTCAKCTQPIQTTYAPERPETVYCEQCYLATVY